MNIFNRIYNFFTGTRLNVKPGKQSGNPGGVARPPAVVNFDSAMTVSAFWASVRLLAETVAAMPLVCYKTTGGSQQVDTNYNLWRVLNYQPNQYQTRTEFFETLVLNLVTDGNCYCAIQRDARGNIISFLPLMSSQVVPVLLKDGAVVYQYHTQTGVNVYAAATIWHIKLFGNGIVGLSPLGYSRQAVGQALAIDARYSQLAANGFKSTGILTIDSVLTPEQRAAIKANFKELTDGNAEKLFVLEAGMKYTPTSLSPADAQLLESKKYHVEDIARFMGVPSVLINDMTGTTWGTGIDAIIQGFYKLNLRPYLERFESSIIKNLMPMSDWGVYCIEFDFDSLLRADKSVRFETLQKGINAGLLAPNEARASEGLPAKKGGDDIYLNGTMIPAGTQSTGAAK